MTGFNHSAATQYGVATFWQITNIHITLTRGVPSMEIILAGYADASDAAANVYTPLGYFVMPLSPTQIATFFATAQPNLIAAITSIWPGATFSP